MHRLTFAEAVNGYVGWHVEGGNQVVPHPDPVEAGARGIAVPGHPGAVRLRAEFLGLVRDSFDRSLPDPVGDESEEQAVRRTLRDGAFRSPGDTATYFSQLADVLLPPELPARLAGHDRLVIEPSPSLARVPWSALRVGPERRMLGELIDVVVGVPASITVQARAPHDGVGSIIALDPAAPGMRPVLGPGAGDGSALGEPGLRLDADWLYDACATAESFLFVGHVSAAGAEKASGESTTMHLTTPVSAGDLLRAGWRAPRRVGLIGCGAGTDLRHPEPFGLAMTAVSCGAELVAASTWTLPTTAALAAFVEEYETPGAGVDVGGDSEKRMGGDLGGRNPLMEFAVAVAEAFADSDPVRHLLDWQVERARAWDAGGHPADNPAIWASLALFLRDPAPR